jgi:hypothetical protein
MSNNYNDTVLLKRDGQAQHQRMPDWLDPRKIRVDDRTSKELFEYLYNIAKEIKFFDHLNPLSSLASGDGNWQELLNYGGADADTVWTKLESLKDNQSLPAHLALLLAFINLYKEPQRLMNKTTGRHLDYYYKEVLGLKKNAPIPDKAHVIFELKKNTGPLLLEANKTKLLAGKDALKKELIYELSHDIIVNNSKVEQLKSIYINPVNKNLLHFAGIANSADGLGAELDKQNPKWNAFGHDALPLAQVGFCLASDTMLMQEGERTISIQLQLDGIAGNIKDNSTLQNLFLTTATTEKGWTDVKTVSPGVERSSDRSASLGFSVSFSIEDPSITPYNPDVHGTGFSTTRPIIKMLLNPQAVNGYHQLKNATLISASISVSVKGMTSLALENDFGVLNPKKPFHPFGPTAETDANFWVGSDEVFSKQLSQLRLNIEWKNIPQGNLGSYYSGYPAVSNNSFSVNASFEDGAGWVVKNDINYLFDAANAKQKDANNVSKQITFTKFQRGIQVLKDFQFPAMPLLIQRSPGTTLLQELSGKAMQYKSYASPIVQAIAKRRVRISFDTHNATIKKGFLHLLLNHGFMFRQYRELFTKQVLDFSKKPEGSTIAPLNEPFAPEIQTLTLDYSATTGTVSFTDDSLNDYAGVAIELYHAAPFGVMREHTYARNQTSFLTSKSVKLLPQFNNEGEFYVGLSGLNANDSLCLLIQVAPGSADPDLPKVDLQWHVLCDNYWKTLSNQDFIFDTTNDFLTSGVIKLIIPREATTENTIMPDGLVWLQVGVSQYSKAVCNLTNVLSNAAIAVFEDDGNDPFHLSQPLPAETITKLQQPVGGIKKTSQPYSSFGGQMQEDDDGFYTRVSERLRHKERSVACWDYERMILQHFPSVYKVKCINHASPGNFTNAGNTLVIVIPDLSNQNAINPFQPRVDKNTLDEILTLLNKHTTTWAEHHVVNPYYEPVKIVVSIRLKTGFEFNYYQNEVNKVLQSFLSPWVNGSVSDIHFGGKITESHIVKLLEDLPYVDYITGLQLFHSTNSGQIFALRKQFIEATTPASILVSHTQHDVKQS